MNLYMTLTVRNYSTAATNHAVESFLRELTVQTDITAIYSDTVQNHIDYTLKTDLSMNEVHRITHDVLNTYHDEAHRKRRHIIAICRIREHAV